jgi:hypothetical protein
LPQPNPLHHPECPYGRAVARIFDDAGWHFPDLTDKVGIQRKLVVFSHQEYNSASFLDNIDIEKTVREGRNVFDRPGFRWELVPNPDLSGALGGRWLNGCNKSAGRCDICSVLPVT